MDEFFIVGKSQFVKSRFQEVFHGFDVVVGRFFNVFDGLSICLAHGFVDVAQLREEVVIHRTELRQRQLGERNEIFYFNPDTVADQCVF